VTDATLRTSDTRAFALALLGIALLTAMDALAKALSPGYGTLQIVFARFALSGAILIAFALVRRTGMPRRDRLPAHLLRALLTLCSNSAFFYALGRLPLAEVFVLSYTAPIFVALFAALLLGEKVSRATAIAIGCGFAGVLVIALAGQAAAGASERPWFAVACAIGSPVAYALGIVLLRTQTAHEPPLTVSLVQALMIAALLVPVGLVEFRLPDAADIPTFLVLGLFAAGGILAFVAAVAKLPAAVFAVADYSGLLWAALLGFVFFSEVPHPSMWLGAALIVSGSAVMLRAKRPS
jgi:S-adenosylmethionine uptake transporter